MNEFETLYDLYQKDIYFFLLKLTGYDNDLTEELTQESFYQAFCTFEKFRGECSVRTWLCQVAKNTFYRHLREQSKQRNLTECKQCADYYQTLNAELDLSSDQAEPDKLLLLTFENNDTTLTNQATATAYDVDGNLLYTLDTFMGHRYWKLIE